MGVSILNHPSWMPPFVIWDSLPLKGPETSNHHSDHDFLQITQVFLNLQCPPRHGGFGHLQRTHRRPGFQERDKRRGFLATQHGEYGEQYQPMRIFMKKTWEKEHTHAYVYVYIYVYMHMEYGIWNMEYGICISTNKHGGAAAQALGIYAFVHQGMGE